MDASGFALCVIGGAAAWTLVEWTIRGVTRTWRD
jgi:hypothetical protein